MSYPSSDTNREDSFDLRKPVLKYVRYWYWFAISLSLALGVAYFVNKFSETVYRATATILVRDDRLGGFRPGRVMEEMDLFHQRNNLFNEMVILNSFSLTDSALRRMDVGVSYYNIGRIVGEMRRVEIYKNTPFWVKWDENFEAPYNRSFHVKILSKNKIEISAAPRGTWLRPNGREVYTMEFGEVYEGEGYRFWLETNNNFNAESHIGREFIFTVHNISALAHRYRGGINISPLNEEASIVQLSFNATHPKRAVDFLNTLMDEYLKQNLIDKNVIAYNTIAFIEEQIKVISDSLAIAEEELEMFRSRKKIMDIGVKAQHLLDELNHLNSTLAIEIVSQQYYDYLQGYIEKRGDFREIFSPSVLGITDATLNRLIHELGDKFATMGQIKIHTTSDNPNVLMLDARIQQGLNSLNETIESLRAASAIAVADLKQRIRNVELQIAALPMTERELLGIKRRFALNEATYNYLMQKRAEAGIAKASNVPDHRIIDRARQTGIVAPQKSKNYIFAIVVGFIAPLLLLILRDFFDTRIYELSDVSEVVDFPVLGIIPHSKTVNPREHNNMLVFGEHRSPATEAFRAMRTNLQYFATHQKSKVIAITSAIPEEGKTFSAINLALALAISERNTILVGGDLRKTAIYRDFGISKSPGLSSYLIGQNQLPEIIQKSGFSPYLDIVTAGFIPPNPSELLESERMRVFINSLRELYDFVIIDTPPVGIVPDGITAIKNSDIAIYIVRQGFTEKSSLSFLKELAKKIDVSHFCIEINDIKPGRSIYEYGYGYAYGKYVDENDTSANIAKRFKEMLMLLFNKG